MSVDFQNAFDRRILILAFIVGVSAFYVEHISPSLSSALSQDKVVTPEVADEEGLVYAVHYGENKAYCRQFDSNEEIPESYEVFELSISFHEDCKRMVSLVEFENYFNRSLEESTYYEEEVILKEGLKHVNDRNYEYSKFLKELHQNKFRDGRKFWLDRQLNREVFDIL